MTKHSSSDVRYLISSASVLYLNLSPGPVEHLLWFSAAGYPHSGLVSCTGGTSAMVFCCGVPPFRTCLLGRWNIFYGFLLRGTPIPDLSPGLVEHFLWFSVAGYPSRTRDMGTSTTHIISFVPPPLQTSIPPPLKSTYLFHRSSERGYRQGSASLFCSTASSDRQ